MVKWIRLSVVLSFSGIGPAAFGLTLEQLQNDLAKHPEAAWTAGETPAAALYHKGDKSVFGLSANYFDDKDFTLSSGFTTPAGAPAALDWRNKDGVNWMSPVRNQGRCGSCVAFAVLAALEGQYNIAAQTPGLDFDFSEQDLFGRIGTCGYGTWPSSAMSVMKSAGVPDETCFPYASGRLGEDQATRGACSDRASRAVKILSSYNVGASGVKAALQQGPVATTMSVYEDFMFYTGGVYRHVSGSKVGGHAVTIVGYDDGGRYLIVKNSWGPDWGEQGYFRISYDDVSGVGNDNYAVSLQVPKSFIKLHSPAYFDAVAGTIEIAAESVREVAFKQARFQLAGTNVAGRVEGSLDKRSMNATVDTTTLPDGVYELKLTGSLADGQVSTPWYSRVIVANQPQAITVSLQADNFDPSKPVKGRVYFNLKTTAGNVPLTAIDLRIETAGGRLMQTVHLDDPGAMSKIGWHAASYPNGTYKLQAIGKLGNLREYVSEVMTLQVAN